MTQQDESQAISGSTMAPFLSFFPKSFPCMIAAVVAAALLTVSVAQASIICSGNLSPTTDPNNWSTTTSARIGNSAEGSLTVDGGSGLRSAATYLGYNTGVSGTVTITGSSSTWNQNGNLFVGQKGTGVLNIDSGGAVTSGGSGNLGYSGGAGTVTVDGTNSTWTNTGLTLGQSGSGTLNITNGGAVTASGSTTVTSGIINVANGGTLTTVDLYATPSQVSGNGAINTSGIVSDTNLTFNAAHGATQSFALNGVTVNLSQSSAGALGVGYFGSGTMNIADGVSVESRFGYIGYKAGSTGTVTVSGAGSTWTHGGATDALYVGFNGTGVLNIVNGGTVRNTTTANNFNPARIGWAAGSRGTVVVDGAGSTWNTSSLAVGRDGYASTGTLSISNGGTVTTSFVVGSNNPANVSINSYSTLTMDVGTSSSLVVDSGSGTITNKGTLRLVAGAGAANDTYTPISAGIWSGAGKIQALGGVWNSADHTVTVSGAAAASGAGGATAAFNTADRQRALITDTATGKSVGAGFQAGTGDVTFNAAVLSPTALAALQNLLASGQSVLSAWNFTTTGYTVSATNPVYLSLLAGAGHSLSDLAVWHYDGSIWSAFTANDLAYNGTYASFTVTGLSGYAVSGTAPVPIPAAAWLLGSGLLGLRVIRRRNKEKKQ